MIDAAGGSWYVESLTDELAQAAWSRFTAIERAGGALAALDDGTIERLLATARDERADDIAHRRAPITGVSEFAFVGEEPVVRAPAPAAPSGGPLPSVRYAQDFEALRDRADAAESRPVVFLAALGPVAAHRARVGFAANLFQVGGIEPVVGLGDLDEIVVAFRASGSTVACLCSANRLYDEVAAPAAQALRAAGATHIWLAGPPRRARCRRLPVHRRATRWPSCARHSTSWGWRDDPRLQRRDPRLRTGAARIAAGGPSLGHAGGHRRPAALHRGRPRRAGLPRHLPGRAALPARPVPDDVRQPAVDDPPVRRLLHRGRLQRVLPPQPGDGAEGAVDRVRPAHPPRLRQRQPARHRRRRHGRGGDRLDLRHAAALRRHPAGQDERVDDDERRGAAGARALRRRGRGAGRRAGAAHRHDPERHPQGVHGPQHLHLPAHAVDADHQRHLLVHLAADAALQLDLDLRLPHPGGRGDGRPGARLHAGRRRRVHPGRARGRPGHRRVRARGCRSSGRSG